MMFRRRPSFALADEDPLLLLSPSRSVELISAARSRRRSSSWGQRTGQLAVLACALFVLWAVASGRIVYYRTAEQAAAGRAVGRAGGAGVGGGATALSTAAGTRRHKRQRPDGTWAPTLLVYVFSNTDPEYLGNLRFFVQFGMAPDDGVEYLVVVQDQEGVAVSEWRGVAGAGGW